MANGTVITIGTFGARRININPNETAIVMTAKYNHMIECLPTVIELSQESNR